MNGNPACKQTLINETTPLPLNNNKGNMTMSTIAYLIQNKKTVFTLELLDLHGPLTSNNTRTAAFTAFAHSFKVIYTPEVHGIQYCSGVDNALIYQNKIFECYRNSLVMYVLKYFGLGPSVAALILSKKIRYSHTYHQLT